MTLTVKNGVYSYGKSACPILRDVSFEARPGDIVAILGPNGAGKTTLLRCTMGFLRWKSGQSLLDGRDIHTMSFRERWTSLAYVPQAKGVASAYTAEEMVLLGRSSHIGVFARPGPEDMDLAHAVMERLHITKLMGKRCSEISGGELQMVLIARALAAEPEILILDEPESNLDFKNQLLIMETLSSLAADGMTCVFNTHFPAHAMQRANKAFLLGETGDWLFGETHRVVTEENIQRAFGVKAVIGEIETPGQVLRDVVPLWVTGETPDPMCRAAGSRRRSLAVVSVILEDGHGGAAEKINALLHAYSRYVVGRMGMPYPEGGVRIITVTLDAPEEEIRTLVAELSILPRVSVKATYARGAARGEEEVPDEEHGTD